MLEEEGCCARESLLEESLVDYGNRHRDAGLVAVDGSSMAVSSQIIGQQRYPFDDREIARAACHSIER